jgi:hypothetical protein
VALSSGLAEWKDNPKSMKKSLLSGESIMFEVVRSPWIISWLCNREMFFPIC